MWNQSKGLSTPCLNVQAYPEDGLDIRMSGTGMMGTSPTTLSPTTLIIDWRCMPYTTEVLMRVIILLTFTFLLSGNVPRKTPYEVEITVPVVGYEPIQFTLSKMCGELVLLLSGIVGLGGRSLI